MGSKESDFNIWLIVRDKVTTLEEKRIQTEVPLLTSPNALPLGQTDSDPKEKSSGYVLYPLSHKLD